MTTTQMTAPTLLLHLTRQGADLSVEGNELVIASPDDRRFLPQVEGRAYELICLLSSRADWLADVGLRERQT